MERYWNQYFNSPTLRIKIVVLLIVLVIDLEYGVPIRGNQSTSTLQFEMSSVNYGMDRTHTFEVSDEIRFRPVWHV